MPWRPWGMSKRLRTGETWRRRLLAEMPSYFMRSRRRSPRDSRFSAGNQRDSIVYSSKTAAADSRNTSFPCSTRRSTSGSRIVIGSGMSRSLIAFALRRSLRQSRLTWSFPSIHSRRKVNSPGAWGKQKRDSYCRWTSAGSWSAPIKPGAFMPDCLDNLQVVGNCVFP